ncbi:unnamed protein product [Allacma fusca]|uniref:Major facilitator superfamily (MFS) profile domain-containing protein n=1 Tax=Allacma fusca TaxID=39272 RepID=A0A8J2KUL2_9HEXA|nr:unnamed protein product [Allacma fusca]
MAFESRAGKWEYLRVLATLAVSLGPFAAGLGKGYSSPALASLQESRNTFPVSAQEGSWVASLPMLGAMFGCLFGGMMLQLGRKMSLLLVALPFSASWLLTFFAENIELMYSTSFIGGFCSAIILLATQVYVSEISHPEIRGCLSSVLKMAGYLGTLSSFALGAFLDWRQLAAVAASAPILLFFAILAIPETPSFLLYHGREEEASKSLAWFRSRGEDVSVEMETLRNNILTKKKRFIPRCSSQLVRQLFITCGLMFFQKFSGVTVFFFYAVPIFKKVFNHTTPLLPAAEEIVPSFNQSYIVLEAGHTSHGDIFNKSLMMSDTSEDMYFINVFGSSLNPHVAAIIVVFLQLLGSMTSGLLIDSAGRLPLLTVSNLFISGSFFGFGLYNWMEEALPPSHPGFGPSYDWIPLTCVLFFTVFFSIGIGPISLLMVGELFPLEYRNFGGAVSTSFSYACAFAAVKTYVDIKDRIGLYGAFWIYSGVSIAGLLFVCFVVPETRGVELEEMEHHSSATRSANQPIYPNANQNTTLHQRHHQINPNPLSRVSRNPNPLIAYGNGLPPGQSSLHGYNSAHDSPYPQFNGNPYLGSQINPATTIPYRPARGTAV